MKRSGVYEILNTANGKRYIGSSKGIDFRWCIHHTELRRNKHHSRHLQAAWNKYGETTFQFNVLLLSSPANNTLYEQLAFAVFCPEYNVCKVAGSPLGVKHSDETRAKVSAAGKGRIVSAETRRKASDAQKGKKRKPLSAEHRAKIGASGKGRILSAETRAKIGVANAKHSPSPEVRARISAALKGRPLSAETRAKMSAARSGVVIQ